MKKIEFRVFVDEKTSPQFFNIVVFPTKKELEKHRWEGKKPPHNTEAYWSPNHDYLEMQCQCGAAHKREMPLLGRMYFHRECLSYGIIAHESFHAVMTWAFRNGANPVVHEVCRPDGNEICAWLMGKLVATIIDGMRKSGKGLKIVNQ